MTTNEAPTDQAITAAPHLVPTEELAHLKEDASRLASAGDWSDAAVEVNLHILALNEEEVDACTRLAKCYLDQGKIVEAREAYANALRLDPSNQIARKNLVRLQQQVSLEAERMAIGNSRIHREVHWLGMAASKRGDLPLAELALRRAIELRPSDLHARNTLAGVYRRAGKLCEARQEYERTLEFQRNHASLVGLAALERDAGHPGRAIERYDEVLRENPNHYHALNGIAAVYADVGDHDTAKRYFELAKASPEAPPHA
jgi:Flp pilus assembly protein TadD